MSAGLCGAVGVQTGTILGEAVSCSQIPRRGEPCPTGLEWRLEDPTCCIETDTFLCIYTQKLYTVICVYILLCVLSVSAEEGAEWSKFSEERDGEGSHEVVTGTREDAPSSDTSSDETRGKVGSNWVTGTTTVSVISHTEGRGIS